MDILPIGMLITGLVIGFTVNMILTSKRIKEVDTKVNGLKYRVADIEDQLEGNK